MIFYFGCIAQSGHYLWTSNGAGTARSIHQYTVPRDFADRFGDRGERLDYPLFTPPSDWPPHHYMRSIVGKWMILSWWDSSVDSRPGSHSTFAGYGFETEEDMLRQARSLFPEVFNRQPRIEKGTS